MIEKEEKLKKNTKSQVIRLPVEMIKIGEKERVGDESIGSALFRILKEMAKDNKVMQKKIKKTIGAWNK